MRTCSLILLVVSLSFVLMGCSSTCFRGEKIAEASGSVALPCKFRLSDYRFSVVPELDRKGQVLDSETASYYNTSVPASVGNASRLKVESALVKKHPDVFSKSGPAQPINVSVIFTENLSDVPSAFVSVTASLCGVIPVKVADTHEECEVRVSLDNGANKVVNPVVMRFACKGWMSLWTPSALLMRDSASDGVGSKREWRGCVPPYREMQTDVYLETLSDAVLAGVRRLDPEELKRLTLLESVAGKQK